MVTEHAQALEARGDPGTVRREEAPGTTDSRKSLGVIIIVLLRGESLLVTKTIDTPQTTAVNKTEKEAGNRFPDTF